MSSKWKSYLKSNKMSDNLQLEAGGGDEATACDKFLSVSRVVVQKKKGKENGKRPVEERTKVAENSFQ